MPLQQNIQNILLKFKLNGRLTLWTTLSSGLINDTFLVTLSDGQQYILQKINTLVFKNAAMLMNNIQLALPFLNGDDYAQIRFVPAITGEQHLKTNVGFWRMMTYIPNSITYNTTTNSDIAFEAGRIVGSFHSLLKNVDPSLFKDTLPKFHHLKFRAHEFNQALTSADAQKRQIAEHAIHKAHLFLTELEDLNTNNLPVRICHNDTKLNNILFSKNTKKALCLIDLDTIMEGYFFYDFGDAIRTVVNNAAEDEQNHDLINFDESLFKAFIDGLITNDSLLTTSELEILPLGAVFMPFIHGLRALTDYLNKNLYYKVTYENQNLDRCLSLFNFAEKALAKKKFMTAYIQERLG